LLNRRYYKKQNELIEIFEGMEHENGNSTAADDASKILMRKSAILAKVSFAMNLVMVVKIFVLLKGLKLDDDDDDHNNNNNNNFN